MIDKYELILGLEVHLQLNTPNKMFSAVKNDPFNSEPNSNVSPVCLGLPGALPVPNRDAIIAGQKIAYALGCDLNNKIIFQRKNYFYPDLPKGYQITCPHYPLGKGGKLDMSYFANNDSITEIRLREVHLEEDTAKSQHKSGKTLIDFNKAGVPLLEIVTEPDFRDIEMAVNYCKEIQLIARYLKVSEADMEKGHMRLEANVSVRKKGETDLPNYRVELKNINSFGFMRKAVLYELRRQADALEKGEKLIQETRGFSEKTGKTFSQRSKEEAHDYRYFPEPDIPPIEFDSTWLNDIATSVKLLPSHIRQELVQQNLNKDFVNVLVGNQNLYSKYKKLLGLGYSPTKSADFIINKSDYANMSPEEIDEAEKSKSAEKITDKDEIKPIISEIIAQNPKVIEDYKSGNENSIQFLIGQIMKATAGKADPVVARSILLESIKSL